jgi:copper chaperone CopZ
MNKFVVFNSFNLCEVTVSINGIVCSACVWLIEHHIKNIYGVHKVFINFSTSKAQIVFDLRLFIDRLDYKLLGDIIVSPIQNFGHFTNIYDAVEYSRRFTKMFPDIGTATILIKEGEYEVSTQCIIDFDLNIRGSGNDTIIRKSGNLALGIDPISGEPDPDNSIFYIGNKNQISSDRIQYGVTLENFTYETSSSLLDVGSAIIIGESALNTQEIFRIKDINL